MGTHGDHNAEGWGVTTSFFVKHKRKRGGISVQKTMLVSYSFI